MFCVVDWRIPWRSVRSGWLSGSLLPPVALPICSLIILSIIENGVLKSLIRIIYMSVSPFSSVGFASCIFWVCFLVHIVCLPDFFVIKNTFYLQPYLFI